MVQVAPRPLTISDYFETPEGGPRYQLIDGDLIPMPTPDSFHQIILWNLAGIISAFLKIQRIGRALFAPISVLLTDVNAFEPDLIFISNERKSIITKRGIEGAPDFVVEVLSPSTARYDKGVKRSIYARTGVVELWLIDPVLREIHVYYLRQDADNPTAVYSKEDYFESPLFPGLKFSCAEIFAE
jgi:Uma2 family endonuclease